MDKTKKCKKPWTCARVFIVMGEWLEECHAQRLSLLALGLGLTWCMGRLCFGPEQGTGQMIGIAFFPGIMFFCCEFWRRVKINFEGYSLLFLPGLSIFYVLVNLGEKQNPGNASQVFSGIVYLFLYVAVAYTFVKNLYRGPLRMLVLGLSFLQIWLVIGWHSPLPVIGKAFLFCCFVLFFLENSFASPPAVRRFFSGFLPLILAVAWGLALVADIGSFVW